MAIAPSTTHSAAMPHRSRCCRRCVGYRGRNMASHRAGTTVKVSVSLDKRDLATLRRHARAAHGGNLSAAFAEAARMVRQREARRALVDKLGGPILDADTTVAIEAEQAGGAPRPRKRRVA